MIQDGFSLLWASFFSWQGRLTYKKLPVDWNLKKVPIRGSLVKVGEGIVRSGERISGPM
jgi:hypothetical protein